jgi:hypothetical protein
VQVRQEQSQPRFREGSPSNASVSRRRHGAVLAPTNVEAVGIGKLPRGRGSPLHANAANGHVYVWAVTEYPTVTALAP